jgi:DNA (cytosine-5)-methyltransferase 1
MKRQLTHGALFAGIGGFMLAAQWAGIQNVWHSEIEKYSSQLLKQEYPDSKNYGDIKAIDWSAVESVDIITGGFPCQPFSAAGKRGGQEDDRYLWPQMFEGIQALRPRWLVGENVPGIRTLALDTVLSDLEDANYASQAFDIPACAVGASHRRHRIWIIAHDSKERVQGHGAESLSGLATIPRREDGRGTTQARIRPDIPAPKLCRTSDGIPDRVHRTKAIGNAIVPQIAYILFSYIQQIEDEELTPEKC